MSKEVQVRIGEIFRGKRTCVRTIKATKFWWSVDHAAYQTLNCCGMEPARGPVVIN